MSILAKTEIIREPQILPENGSVVIIDDQINEALPIVKALSKKGISTTYYQGEKSDLPASPVQSVRLVFLDLQLLEIANENTIAKFLVSILTRIISKDNGPYLLVIWSSKFHQYSDVVKDEINSNIDIKPACIVNIEKAACLEKKTYPIVDVEEFTHRISELLEGKLMDQDLENVQEVVKLALKDEVRTEFVAKFDAVDIIEEQLKLELQKAGSFHLFVIWENIVKRAASKMVYDVSSLVSNNEYWESNMKNIFQRMGVARAGQNELYYDELVRESINTLNTSLLDNIETEIKKEKLPESVSIKSNILIGDIIDQESFVYEYVDEKDIFYKNGNKLFGPSDRKGTRKGIENSKNITENDKTALFKLVEKHRLIPFALNTKLHIELAPSQELIPGNIYLNSEPQKREKYLKTFFKDIKGQNTDYHLIDLEVSPVCDYAQNKWKRSRTLPGILFPAEHFSDLHSKSTFYYDVEPTFSIEGKQYRFRFDFHLFNALDKTTAKSRTVVYRFKRELLLDIIAQLSSHVNRPGISFIQ